MSDDEPRFSAQEYGALLGWMMVSDPWPADYADYARVVEILDDEANARGYDGWVHAYHEFRGEEDTVTDKTEIRLPDELVKDLADHHKQVAKYGYEKNRTEWADKHHAWARKLNDATDREWSEVDDAE